ncbi:MAG: TIGR02757 family protein [Paramuribaculum sp.]|nr:TIGR02757 family protein [Paramuribaculum sp.]
MIANVPTDIIELLDSEARRINSPAFINADPVQFPRRFEDKRDIEIVSLLASTIAWGNRKMICRNIDRMLALTGHDPYNYLMDEGYEDLNDEDNIHRTFFNRHFKHLMRGLRTVYATFGSLEDYARKLNISDAELPSWKLVEGLNRVLSEANEGNGESRCFPLNLQNSALKRVNMALRWLVRDDGIVDMGIWKVLKPSQLYIPLDVHVGNTARELGLLNRKANDKKSAVDLTETLRSIRPEDPVWYDYALFGIGVGVDTSTQ